MFETKPAGYRADAPRLLLLDEVTQAPRWDLSLKQLVDRARAQPPATRDRILVTDSAAALLRRDARETLEGRVDEVRIHGLTFREALHLQSADGEPEREVLRSPGALERYLAIGGLPEHQLAAGDDRPRIWERVRSDVADRAIARDLSREDVDVERVTALFRCLVQDSGGVFTASNRARDLGADNRTVGHWVALLEQAWLLNRLLPWHPGLRRGFHRPSRALRSRPKVFAGDHGYIPAFSPFASPMAHTGVRASVFEATVFTHLRALRGQLRFQHFFYRENDDVEIDFVLDFDDVAIGIEVTSAKSPDKKLGASRSGAERAGVDRLIVVHGGPIEPHESEDFATWPIGAFLLDPAGCIQRSLEWARKSR